LGKSETSSSVPDLFATAGKTDKLYIRKDVPGRFMPVTSLSNEQNLIGLNTTSNSENKHTDFQKTADDIMLRKYMPAGVVVNEAMDIVHFRGSTAIYLEQAPGKPSHNLLKMAKDGLPFELRNIIHKAKKENISVSKENIPVKINGEQHLITIEAIPLPDIVEPHYLILFHDQVLPSKVKGKKLKSKVSSKEKKTEKDHRIEHLEQELAQTREDMRSITEDQQAANEELQSANEELLSGSEELQSLNEELETSKEELQTTNEELVVLNQELISLNEQVTTARNYAESIITTIQEPLLVLDKTLRVKTANNAFYKTFHVTEEDTVDALIYELGNKQWNTSTLRKLLEEILPQKTKFADFEVEHEFPTIGKRIMLLYGCEIPKEKSEENLILLVLKDITEHVTAKNKNLAAQQLRAQELEEKVQQRTIELSDANELLQERNKELAKINKELESFTYVSSHDLQEPLRKIQTFTSWIQEKEYAVLSDIGKDYFVRIQSAASRMQQLIKDLLAFSKINLDERKFEKTDLNIILQEVENELKETIAESHAIIETTELCEANIIPFQFRQLIHNLISNALKFSKPKTPVQITISSRNTIGSKENNINLVPGKEYCHITFMDNGIGFEPRFSEQIFEVFQRLHDQEDYSGTGIGLAIVKKIVENHNGVISATSELGKGAKFDIYIPV
jgi:two-component system CheB/CheR fusion protein